MPTIRFVPSGVFRCFDSRSRSSNAVPKAAVIDSVGCVIPPSAFRNAFCTAIGVTTTMFTDASFWQRQRFDFMVATSSPQISRAIWPISWSWPNNFTAILFMLRFDEQRERRSDVSMLARYSPVSE